MTLSSNVVTELSKRVCIVPTSCFELNTVEFPQKLEPCGLVIAIFADSVIDETATLRRAIRPLPRRLPANMDIDARTEDEIDQRILQLKIKRNSLQNILRVPPEILSQISLEYVNLMRTGFRYQPFVFSPRPRPNAWINIAHICHHWREVALRTASLWASFDASSLQLIQELLARSKAIPLCIKMANVTNDHRVVLEKIMGLASRIQEIDLQISTVRTLEDLRPSFPREAARLRTLSLQVEMIPSSLMRGFSRIPLIFDGCELPALTSLTLRRMLFDWTSNLFTPSLTQLVVETSIANYGEFLTALDKMSKLCHLRVELKFRTRAGPPFPEQNRQVSLPNLKQLHLSTTVRICSYLLSQLEYPSTACVALWIQGKITSRVRLEELTPVVFSKFQEFTTPVMSASVWFEQTPYLGTSLGFWMETIRLEALFYPMTADGPSIPPLFRIHMNSNHDNQAYLLSRIGDFAPLVQTIVYRVPHRNGQENVPKASWIAASQVRQDVEYLGLDSGPKGIKPFLEALLDDTSFQGHQAFQKLKTLRITSARFTPGSLQAFLTILQRRRETQFGLPRLELSFCRNINEVDIDRFREFVDFVDWDGYIDFHTSDAVPNEMYDDDDDDDDEF
ncbi:hypothetical protein NLI96_g4527 [Meripilus lineatus]|uniref:F-box domain-containing protein n=1 Tax=Meripilus lineatus TaxID=2056292 RepID=A0AAD5YFL2_9APHY|nr:hypothetical protein NLI96_g4527 [Physisporinus lineatus]